MALMRDVFPMDYDSRGQTPREAARGSIRLLVEAGLLQPGDRAIIFAEAARVGQVERAL